MALPESLQRDALKQYPELAHINPHQMNMLLGYAYRRGYSNGIIDSLGTNPTFEETIKAYDLQNLIRIHYDKNQKLMSIKYNLYADSFDSYNRSPEALSWNLPYMKQFRGIVVDTQTYEVIARPYPKFFNLNENELAKWPTNYKRLEALEKLDGSLFIYTNHPKHGEIFASSGSTDGGYSEYFKQYIESHLSQKQRDALRQFGKSKTLLFEFTGPLNKVVIDYPNQNMTLHGAINTATGEEYSYTVLKVISEETGIDLIKRYQLDTQEDVLNWMKANDNNPNVEGLVLLFTHTDGSITRLKLKASQYTEVHYELSKLKGLFRDYQCTILTHRAKELIGQMFIDESLDDFIASITVETQKNVIIGYINTIKSTLAKFHEFKELHGEPTKENKRSVYTTTTMTDESRLFASNWAHKSSDKDFIEDWIYYN